MTAIFFFFLWTYQSFSIQLLKKLPMKRVEIRMMKFEAAQIHFLKEDCFLKILTCLIFRLVSPSRFEVSM